MFSAVIRDTRLLENRETSARLPSIQSAARKRPIEVFGVLAPYPTVVIVTAAQHEAVVQRAHRGLPRMLRSAAGTVERPHQPADRHQQNEHDREQRAEFGSRGTVIRQRGEQPGLARERGRDAGPMGRRRKVDAREPLGRDGDRPDRRVEFVLFQACENCVHARNQGELITPMHLLGGAPPEVDAGPGK